MRNITAPRTVSFEEALRNLASRLTGVPASALPRTQEGVVQFMAENIPTVDEMAEAITKEVLARLAKDGTENAEDAPVLPADGANEEQAPKDTTAAQSGSENATGAAKRNKTKSTD